MFNPWVLLPEPRRISFCMGIIYTAVMLAGISVSFNPPPKLSQNIGDVLIRIIGLTMGIGGLFGAVSIPKGIWFLERAGIYFAFVGIVTYGYSLVVSQTIVPSEQIFRGLLSLIIFIFFIIRLILISGISVDPVKYRGRRKYNAL